MPETQDWAAPLASPAILTVDTILEATPGGGPTQALVGLAGHRYVLVAAWVTPFAPPSTGKDLREWVIVVVWNGAQTVKMGSAAISPETPFAVVPVTYGAAQTAVGEGFLLQAWSRPGSGNQEVGVSLQYYTSR